MLYAAIALRALAISTLVLMESWALDGLVHSGDWTWLVFSGVGALAACVLWWMSGRCFDEPPRKIRVEDYEVPF